MGRPDDVLDAPGLAHTPQRFKENKT